MYIERILDNEAAHVNEDKILLALSKEPEANIPVSPEEEAEIEAMCYPRIHHCKFTDQPEDDIAIGRHTKAVRGWRSANPLLLFYFTKCHRWLCHRIPEVFYPGTMNKDNSLNWE